MTNKKQAKVTDPVRFPKVINGFESVAKRAYYLTLDNMLKDLKKELNKLVE